MNSKLYRCGWCGIPTDANGINLQNDSYKKAVNILEKYGDYRTHKVNGECCRQEQEMVQITKDMAIDAGDRNLEGQWINS